MAKNADCMRHCSAHPQCAIVSCTGHVNWPPLHPIPVQKPFQIVGLDVMDLPKTAASHKDVVFQDYFTKWPLVFHVADQKAITTNLFSHLIKDVCLMLGIKQLNPQHIIHSVMG